MRLKINHLLILIMIFSALLSLSSCEPGTPRVQDKPQPQAAAQPASTLSEQWYNQVLEKRIKAIQNNDYPAFIETDAEYKREIEQIKRLTQPTLRNTKTAELTNQYKDFFTRIQSRNLATNPPLAQSLFAFEGMSYKILEAKKKTGFGDERYDVFVECSFANKDKSPTKLGPRPLKSVVVKFLCVNGYVNTGKGKGVDAEILYDKAEYWK